MKLERVIGHLCANAGVLAFFLLLPGLAYAGSAANTGVSAYKVGQIVLPSGSGIYPANLNKSQTVVGSFVASSGATEGFSEKKGVFTTLVFPGSNGFTRGNGINDSGTVVGDFYLSSDNGYHGFLYKKGKYTQYDVELGVVSTSLFGVNNAGDLAGSIGANGNPNQGFVTIGDVVSEFYATGTDSTFAYAINNSDEAVGQYYDSSNNSHGFYRDATGKITLINYPAAVYTTCSGINDSGVITGYYEDSSGGAYGFLYSAGVYTKLPFFVTTGINDAGDLVGLYPGPPGPGGTSYVQYGFVATPKKFGSYANVEMTGAQSTNIIGINDSKAMVGVYTDGTGATHGLLYAKKKITNIDDPKAQAGTTAAIGINTAGEIVGGYTNGSGVGVGFLYSGGTFTDIAPSGAQYTEASGINDSGVIAGVYVDSSGNEYGFTFNGSTYTKIDVPGSLWTASWGVNNSGDVTCQWGDLAGFIESSIYNGSSFTTIDVPNAFTTGAHSINANGDVAFVWGDPFGNNHGAILSKGDYYIFDVPPTDGTGTDADGINDTGEMVGHFTPTGSSAQEGWMGKL